MKSLTLSPGSILRRLLHHGNVLAVCNFAFVALSVDTFMQRICAEDVMIVSLKFLFM